MQDSSCHSILKPDLNSDISWLGIHCVQQSMLAAIRRFAEFRTQGHLTGL